MVLGAVMLGLIWLVLWAFVVDTAIIVMALLWIGGRGFHRLRWAREVCRDMLPGHRFVAYHFVVAGFGALFGLASVCPGPPCLRTGAAGIVGAVLAASLVLLSHRIRRPDPDHPRASLIAGLVMPMLVGAALGATFSAAIHWRLVVLGKLAG